MMIQAFKKSVEKAAKAPSMCTYLLWSNKLSAFFIYFGFLLNAISWALLVWFVRVEQAVVIVHYNSFLGIDIVQDFNQGRDYIGVFIVPLVGLFIWILNFVMSLILCSVPKITEAEKTPIGESENVLKNGQKDASMIGMLLLVGGAMIVQVAVVIYVIAVLIVNR